MALSEGAHHEKPEAPQKGSPALAWLCAEPACSPMQTDELFPSQAAQPKSSCPPPPSLQTGLHVKDRGIPGKH